MPTLRDNGHYRNLPWQARRKRDGEEINLGYFATRREAERAEAEFDLAEARRVVTELERRLRITP